jgi:uncharacterized protein YjbI with pentapeptide repeats
MDRDEALKLLTGGEVGVAEWNRRREAGEEIPRLTGARLTGARLHNARLDGASLDHASLDHAKLAGASLNNARLAGASFVGARLVGARLAGAGLDNARLDNARLDNATLDGASLVGAILDHASLDHASLVSARLDRASLADARLVSARLDGASLVGAFLHGARLDHARLDNARLVSAKCSATVFARVDLSETQGLDTIHHFGPSTVGVDTLFRSKGKIPKVFLRGCGVPESLIAYLPALIGAMSPIQFYSCFISHSSKDVDFAQRLHARLEQAKLRVWYAPEDIQGGKKLHEQIDEAIRVYDKLLLVLSPNSIDSMWVRDEVRRARKAEVRDGVRKLFPIRVMNYEALGSWKSFYADFGEDLAEEVREYFIPDFTNWKDHDVFEGEFARLLRDLQASEPSEKVDRSPSDGQ